MHAARTAPILAVLVASLSAQQPAPNQERDFLTRVRRLTVEGKRAGEGYWSPDGKRIVFQSEREPGNPFYQIYTLDLGTGDTKRISPGIGKTTCAFFRPGSDEIEFASTHADPKSKQWQDEELAFRASGKERRYSWDYDPEMDIYAYSEKTGTMKRLTTARGYDAEGSYSPDGQWIAFSSMRDAYNRPLTDREKKELDQNPSYFAEIYIMRADGSGQKRLTSRRRVRRRPVLHPRRLAHRLAPVRRAGADRRRLDDEARRHGSEADHRLRIDELGAVRASVGPVLHLLVEQARLRELRVVHGRRAGHQGAGARDLLRRLRRAAGAVAGREDAGLDLEPLRRIRRSIVPGAVESRKGARGAQAGAATKDERKS